MLLTASHRGKTEIFCQRANTTWAFLVLAPKNSLAGFLIQTLPMIRLEAKILYL
jgi:hypothetical protein